MNRATYNITNDRLKVWFAERLSKEDYAKAKSLGFVYWFGSKCLTCVWRPWAEDFITSRGIEIEEDDAPDDAEGRADRFAGYAERAEASAESRSDYLHTRANTERRQRLALNGAVNETEKAAYWQHRIERVIAHAKFKDRPDVIARRIDVLETDARRHTASFTPHTDKAGNVIRYGSQVIVGPKGGRGGHAVEESSLPAREKEARRWLDHIENRLIYERAQLAAAGGIQADLAAPGGADMIEVGGAVLHGEDWFEVTKKNPATIEVFGHKWPHAPEPWHFKLAHSSIGGVVSKLRVDSEEVRLRVRAPKIEKGKPEKLANRAGEFPEKFGAFGSSSSFHDDRSKPVDRWFLITRVNQKTVEYLNVYTEQILTADGATKSRRSFSLRKEDVRTAGRFISPAQVKKECPDLLKEFADFEAVLARIEAKKAAAPAPEVAA